MSDFFDERDYAKKMLLAAVEHQARGGHLIGLEPDCSQDIADLIEEAMDAGCCRTELIIQLAKATAKLAARSTVGDPVAAVRAVFDEPLVGAAS